MLNIKICARINSSWLITCLPDLSFWQRWVKNLLIYLSLSSFISCRLMSFEAILLGWWCLWYMYLIFFCFTDSVLCILWFSFCCCKFCKYLLLLSFFLPFKKKQKQKTWHAFFPSLNLPPVRMFASYLVSSTLFLGGYIILDLTLAIFLCIFICCAFFFLYFPFFIE